MKILANHFILLLISVWATACVSSAQPAKSGQAPAPRACVGRTVSSDAELQALAGCTQVVGDLTVSGTVSTLEPLRAVASLWGTLAVHSTDRLRALHGLGALRAASNVVVSNNARLEDLGALRTLRAVRNLTITGNPKLETLTGLEGLRSVERLTIASNGLYTLHGLGNVYSVGDLVITDNPRLNDVRGLAGVIEVRSVVLEHNPRLCRHFGILPKLRHAPTVDSVAQNGLSVVDAAQLTAER